MTGENAEIGEDGEEVAMKRQGTGRQPITYMRKRSQDFCSYGMGGWNQKHGMSSAKNSLYARKPYVAPRDYNRYKYRTACREDSIRISKWGRGNAEAFPAGPDGWSLEQWDSGKWEDGENCREERKAGEYTAEEYDLERLGQEECSEEKHNVALHPRSLKKRCRSIALACFAVLCLLALAGGYVYYQLPYRCVKESVTMEAGEKCPSVEDFLEWEYETASIVSGIDPGMEFGHVEDYAVVIHLYHRDVTTILHVEDTTPPEIQTRDRTIMFGETFALEDFVENVTDNTDWSVSYKEEPDIPCGGIYRIMLEAEDEGGNVTEAEARLEVLQDVTPPLIEGVRELTITAGESVSYKKGVTVTDDYDETVELTVDNSAVDTDTPGDYEVIYRATDRYGNMAEVVTVLHVKEVPKTVLPAGSDIPMTAEAVNAEADRILASITNSSMSQYEVIKAIYDWVHTRISYKNGTPKTDWVTGAYYGLVLEQGDCFAFAMASKCLLDRAGITNMDIERIRVGNGMHFWNLVDIGEGWHHFDTCRRGDGVSFFYLTDAELMEYSNAHVARDYPNGSHYYDRSLYPEIP